MPLPLMSHDPNRHRVMILSSEVDSAAAMMALGMIRRYKEVAIRSYRPVIDLIAVTSLTPQEEQEIWGRLTPIQQWLGSEGLLGTQVTQPIAVDSLEPRELAALLAPKRPRPV